MSSKCWIDLVTMSISKDKFNLNQHFKEAVFSALEPFIPLESRWSSSPGRSRSCPWSHHAHRRRELHHVPSVDETTSWPQRCCAFGEDVHCLVTKYGSWQILAYRISWWKSMKVWCLKLEGSLRHCPWLDDLTISKSSTVGLYAIQSIFCAVEVELKPWLS